MSLSQEQIEEEARKILSAAGIEKAYKPNMGNLMKSLGLKVKSVLNLQDGIMAKMVVNPNSQDLTVGFKEKTVLTNARNNSMEQRFALAYMAAFYVLNKDSANVRKEGVLTNKGMVSALDDAVNLANALLLDKELFDAGFKKAMSGIPNKAAICKNLGAQFNVPLYSIEGRANDTKLKFPQGGEIRVGEEEPTVEEAAPANPTVKKTSRRFHSEI